MKLSRALVALALLVTAIGLSPTGARAQVVVLVNGSPVTALDIAQRSKLKQVTTQKTPTRDEVIQELIDDHLKVFVARRYGLEISESDVDSAFANMAKRGRLTAAQMQQSLAGRGVAMPTLRARIRADLAWSQLVRGRYSSSLQIGESDINLALKQRGAEENATAYIYTLYPIVVVSPRGSEAELKRREAENLRSRFQSCEEGLKLARALRDVAVREPITRNSADLTPQLRELLGRIEVGRLTSPEPTAAGLEMFAVCDKKENKSDSPAKSAVREEIFTKRFEVESKKFLEEIRRQAMIEYK